MECRGLFLGNLPLPSCFNRPDPDGKTALYYQNALRTEQANLQQPLKEWFSIPEPKDLIENGGLDLGGNGSSTNGGSTSQSMERLHPRHDVDFSKAKTIPK
jgi:hypothetical protein